jgi:DNA-directed RNA polymerase subunit RPC12/RpoP
MAVKVLTGLAIVLFWVVVLYIWWTGGECPKCKRPRAEKATGRKSSSDHYTREFRCRYCNHRWWQDTYVP